MRIELLIVGAGILAGCCTHECCEDGYRPLFNGHDFTGWTQKGGGAIRGWTAKDGVLTCLPNRRWEGGWKWTPLDGAAGGGGGDLYTVEKFRDFDLRLEFRIEGVVNSGIKYFYDPEYAKGTTLEYQILDPEHPMPPNTTAEAFENRRVASLYYLFPAHAKAHLKPRGEWNEARIVSKGRQVEHWLNGVKVLAYERGGQAFREAFKATKWNKPEFQADGPWGEAPEGHILLQDHSDKVFFRNIRIRRLESEPVFDSAFPGGNVRLFGFDGETGVVSLDSDFRDSVPDQFWTYFRVRGAAGRKLTFNFTGEGPFKRARVSRAGMAYSLDEGKTWGWTSSETDHTNKFGFAFSFPTDADSVRFATTIPYLGADLEACLAAHPELRRTVLAKSRKGRDIPLVTVGPEDAKVAFAATARHHALEATASWVMEGMMEAASADTPEGRWIRGNLRCSFVPFMDVDGVEEGDPGKNRRPHDPNRDYIAELYPEVKAFKALVRSETAKRRLVFFDLHAPQVRGSDVHPAHDNLFTMGPPPEMEHYWNDYRKALIEETKDGPIRYYGTWDQRWGTKYNVPAKNPGEMKSNTWVLSQPNILWLPSCWEFGYGRCGGIVSREGLRGLGRAMMNVLARQLASVAAGSDGACISR